MMHMLASFVYCVFKVRKLSIGAQVVNTVLTVLALAAGLGERAEANNIADFQVFDTGANSKHMADNFMTRDQRVAREIPVVVDHVDVRCADACKSDPDISIKLCKWFWWILVVLYIGPGFQGRHGCDLLGNLIRHYAFSLGWILV